MHDFCNRAVFGGKRMGFFSADLESMVELYQRETAELMEMFDTRQAGAVQENHFSKEDINAVFRAVHTIKSSAAVMGLADISTCTHRMEDLFLIFRDQPERMQGYENRIFDLMYLFSDYIENENSRVSQEDFRPGSAGTVIAAINKEIAFFSSGPQAGEERKSAGRTGNPDEGRNSGEAGKAGEETDDAGVRKPANHAEEKNPAGEKTAEENAEGENLAEKKAAAENSAGKSPAAENAAAENFAGKSSAEESPAGKNPKKSSAEGDIAEESPVKTTPAGEDLTAGAKAAGSAAEVEELTWRVFLHANCQMENVRAFMLVRQIRGLCKKVATVPPNLEAPEAAAQIAEKGFLLKIVTDRPDEAEKKVISSPYVKKIEKIGRPAGETQAAGIKSDGEETRNEPGEAASPNGQNKFSMISWEHVTHLQDVTGELITANAILGASLKKLVKGGAIENEVQTMNRLFLDLEKLVASISMMPVASILPQYQRLVRDIAMRENKQIRMKIVGGELEADRNLLDTLTNPLIHLLRNAADHGIESPEERTAAGKDPCGTVTLKFENLTDHLRVTVEDDGAGMNRKLILQKALERGLLTKSPEQYSDEEILGLVFSPGLTTNDRANQFSGRGVGMDVAQSMVNNLGGSVMLKSTQGKGSSVIMEVPVSVTSAECIRFLVGSCICMIPIRSILRICSQKELDKDIQEIDGRLWLRTDEMIPVLDMFRLYEETENDVRRIILIRSAGNSAALMTGPVVGQQITVEKVLPSIFGRNYRERTGIIGVTITETGKIGLMLNADRLIRICGKEKKQNGDTQGEK